MWTSWLRLEPSRFTAVVVAAVAELKVEDLNVSNALRHLQEMTTFFRVHLGSQHSIPCISPVPFVVVASWLEKICRLGSFPQAGSLVGLENLGNRIVISSVGVFVSWTIKIVPTSPKALPLNPSKPPKKRIGVLGFGTFGQFIASRLGDEACHDFCFRWSLFS